MPQFDLMNLVLTWASHGPGTQLDRVALFPTRGSPDTFDCGRIYASPGPSDSVPHLGLHGPSDSGPHQASLGPGYSIPQLGLTLTRDLSSHSGPQTKLVTLVPTLGLTLTWLVTPWASLGPGESGS